MFNWVAKIFYRKKVKRLEQLAQALEYLGAGHLRAVHSIISSIKPSEYLEDLALYYFVKGRLALEELEIEKAEIYLMTAWALGFRRTPIYISLGLAKARLRKLGEAKELLIIASERSDDEQSEIVSALLELIDKVAAGSAKIQISNAVSIASKRILHKPKWKNLKEQEWKTLITELLETEVTNEETNPTNEETEVTNEETNGKTINQPTLQDQAIAVIGSFLVKKHNGTWEYGIEMTDHAVLISGVAYKPVHFISAYKAGKITIDNFGDQSKFNVLSNVFLEEEGLIINNTD